LQVGELLHDWRRLNVCFTRAKSKLLLIGSRATLEASPVLASFFELCDERGWIMPVPPSLDCLGSL
jgi:DNA replication ATP-dependent helicase Dna2